MIFVDTDAGLRDQRLRQREWQRFGERIAPGGDMYETSQAFLAWAAGYDDGTVSAGRNRLQHEAWLAGLSCLRLRVNGGQPWPGALDEVLGRLAELPHRTISA